MAVPTFTSINPTSGPAGGRSLAVITGTNFRIAQENGLTVLVQVDGVSVPLHKTEVLSDTTIRIEVPAFSRVGAAALLETLPAVDVRIANLDDDQVEIPGEAVVAANAYTHQRGPILPPAATPENQHYYRVIIEVINNLQRQVLLNTSIGTSVDYGEFGEVTIAQAELPAITLVGPRFTENFSVRHQWMDLPDISQDSNPNEFHRRWHGYVVDMEFDIIIGSTRRAEIFALTQSVIEMFLRTPYIEIPAVPGDVNGEKHEFPLVLVNAPNVTAQDSDSDMLTSSGLFQVRWVPIRLPQTFQIGHEVLEGEIKASTIEDTLTEEAVPFADED